MKKVLIYTTSTCPYCVKAKALLTKKNINFEEINVDDPLERKNMIEKSGGRKSVPQIFFGDQHIGGCDDLYELESKNMLDNIVR